MTETGTPDVGFIKKRDGRSERFDGAKIVEAMRRAFEDVADEQAAARGLIAGHGGVCAGGVCRRAGGASRQH